MVLNTYCMLYYVGNVNLPNGLVIVNKGALNRYFLVVLAPTSLRQRVEIHLFTLCFALLCFALLCFALLCFALLCFALLCFALLCFALLCFALKNYLVI
jgi:hypothetical protein